LLRKCALCDDKDEKTIDTSESRYVKAKEKYWHFDCYKLYLTTKQRAKLKEEDALLECLRLEEITKNESIEHEIKESLFRMLVNYYEVPIDSNFFIKVDAISKGKYKGISNQITYSELFEMYSNHKMIEKLEKLGYDKNIKKQDRIHWDLGVMVNEYPRYVKAKLKNKALEQSTIETIESMQKYKTTHKSELYKDKIENTKEKNENETRVDDLVKDLFDF